MHYQPIILNEVMMMTSLWEIYLKHVLTVAPTDIFVDVGVHIGTLLQRKHKK
jgi:hypothetical protein